MKADMQTKLIHIMVFVVVLMVIGIALSIIKITYMGDPETRLRKKIDQMEVSARKAEEQAESLREQLMEIQTKGEDTPTERRVNVEVEVLDTEVLVDTFVLPAEVEAAEDIALAARSAGPIEWIGPDEGERVKKGELIMRIDAETQQQALKSAKAAAQLAKANYERVQNLSKKGVSTDEALDQARSTLQQAEATLSIAEQNLADAHLKSPINGVVDELPFDVGEFVNRGQMVAHIVDIASVEVVVNVPEKDVTYLNEGQLVEVKLPGEGAGEVTGKIERIRLVADEMSRTYRVEARIPNPDGLLRPGMITKMELMRRENPEAIVLPMFAILQTQDGPVVYLENDGTAKMRPVKTGARRGKEVEILSGLQAGERLIVKGHRTLTDGALVEVLETEPETAQVDEDTKDSEL